MKELMKLLSEAHGAPGEESEVCSIIKEELKNYVDEIKTDRFGNLITQKKGSISKSPKIMFTAHMDEIALKVEYIEKNGLIRFVKTGSIDDRILPARHVVIHTNKGKVPGVIGMIAPHLLTSGEENKVISHQKLSIDVGANNIDDIVKMGIQIGDAVTFRGQTVELANGFIAGKAIDNRVGCAAMIETMRRISKINHKATVFAVGTVQEEVGFRGAKVAVYGINPDVVIAIDTTAMHPDDPKSRICLGKGPIIRLLEQVGDVYGIIVNKKLKDLFTTIAEEEEIPYQLLVRPFGATDASITHLSKEGILSCSIEVPSRYIHTSVEVFKLDDLQLTCKLLTAFVERYEEIT